MTEFTFKQRETSWVGETDALGKSVLQVQRKAKGSLFHLSVYSGNGACALQKHGRCRSKCGGSIGDY